MFALVSYITGEVLSYAAMPVRTVSLVEELLDDLSLLFFCFLLINGFVDHLFDVVFHLLVHLANDPVHTSLRHALKKKFKLLIIIGSL